MMISTNIPDGGTSGASGDSQAERSSGAGGGSPIDFGPMFEAAPIGMLLADEAGRIVRTNARLDAMFGYGPGQLLDQPGEALFPERYRESHAGLRGAYHARSQKRVVGFDRDLTGLRKDGEEFPLEIDLCTIEAADGPRFCAMIVDLTERNRSARRLHEAETMLEEVAQALARDMHDQIHIAAGEVARSAEDHSISTSDARRGLRRVSETLFCVEHLVSELVLYSGARHFPLPAETIDLGAVIDEAIALESPGAGVSIDVSVPSETFFGARSALSGVLRSLLSNAIKHHDREEVKIAIRARLEGDQCLIDFTDDGPGIPEAEQQRVFRLFHTLNEDQGLGPSHGSGMGLAIVERLVEGHGGSIILMRREDGRGSRFRLWWPRYVRSDRAA